MGECRAGEGVVVSTCMLGEGGTGEGRAGRCMRGEAEVDAAELHGPRGLLVVMVLTEPHTC